MKNIYWDLDGVLRDIDRASFKVNSPTWDRKEDGDNIFDKIKKEPSLLIAAPPTEYFETAIKFSSEGINILTSQPLNWRSYTAKWVDIWIRKYIKNINLIFVNHPLEKLNRLSENDFLIEDYPKFPDYDKIILIRREYNKHIQKGKIASNPSELISFMLQIKEIT